MKKPFSPRSGRSGSEGLRISQEIAAIQAALHQQGYRTRKQPRQPAWKVFTCSIARQENKGARGTGRGTEQTEEYLLTFQPAPISAWVLHPNTNSPQRHAIEMIIQHTLNQLTTLIRKTS